jgi:FkbM family methyltransferase
MGLVASLGEAADNLKVAGTRGAVAYVGTRLGRRPPVGRGAMRDGFPSVSLRLGSSDVQIYRQIFERQEYRCLAATRPALIIDAGAHIGLATLYFASCFPSAEIIAIEPHPENFSILRRNVASFENVTPIRAALWDRSEPVRLVNPEAKPSAFRIGRIADSVASASQPIADGVVLEQVLRMSGRDRIDILKLDIEGAEKRVLAQAAGVLDRVETILAELHDELVPGCSRTFYALTASFETEWRRGEITGVSRHPARLP